MIKASEDLKFKLIDASLMLMFALPLFPTNVKPYVIIFLGLSVLIGNLGKPFSFDLKKFLINSFIYLLMIVSLLYSQNMEYGLNKLETMSSLVLFPLIFALFPKCYLNDIFINLYKYLTVYFIAILSFNLISFFYHGLHYGETIFIHYPTVNKIAQGPYNIHPIYLSIHICVALLFSFFIIRKLQSNYKRAAIILFDIILILFLFILLKKGPIIVLALVFLIFALFQRSKKVLYIALFVIILNVVAIMSIPEYRAKFSELVKIENVDSGGATSTNIRYSIYSIAIKKMIESPIIGYGIGDGKDVLLETYKEESPILYKEKYNSHNQYISFMLALGIIGLMVFLFFMSYNLVYAIRYNNQILILLLLLYGLMMSFENIMEREDGVIYFSFFIGFFALKSYNEKLNEKVLNGKNLKNLG
ncbi:O-antigen ligase family protein [Winogradskyella forsetii]|uniref:O-antigen ligase family protein n=1 Tax=Winogradskyella forsetii TaxID=2686077 RepID=UPI0015C13387|nr:O-antigen ligase family protein [Winogradskyella forsetii]